MSSSRTYLLRLSGSVDISVELTGMTTDFDCTVSGNRCTNRGSTRDDSWSGDLAAGNHSVVVYPYRSGPGNYSLTVTATETVNSVTTPLGGGPPRIRLVLCDENDGRPVAGTCREVVTGAGPGQGTPGPGDGGDGGDGGGGPQTPSPTRAQKENTARTDATARAQSQSCQSFFESHNPSFDLVQSLNDVSFDDSDPRNVCGSLGFNAYAEIGGANTVFTCDPFYNRTAVQRADTVLHEMLHIAGKTHDDLGGEGPFAQAVRNACP